MADVVAATVRRICASLDGLPLAIELAAARLPVLTLDEIADRLDQQLQLLSGRTGGRSLRAALNWSHALLNEPEQRLFRRLAVFAGGFDLPALEAICADGHGSVLDPLSGLVARSLVQVDEHGTAKRFRLLEVVRQYAAEHLEQCGEVGTVSLRHATYYCELAEQAERERRGPQRPRWRVRLRDEDANFRTALRWVLDTGNGELALRLAGTLWWYWFDAPREGIAWLREVVQHVPVGRDYLRQRANLGVALLAAVSFHPEAVELACQPKARRAAG